MDRPEDILYLKQFVKEHPDNRMGWYLLGKHYRDAGKEGKANYCFIRAGDIYEAYEQESHPLAEQQLEQLREWGERHKKKRLLRKLLFIAVPLLVLALLVPLNFTQRNSDDKNPVPPAAKADTDTGVLIVPAKELKPLGYAMNQVAGAGNHAPELSLAVRMEEDGGWQQWNGKVRHLLSIRRLEDGKKLETVMYDRNACICEPASAKEAESRYNDWKSKQELHWTLASGILQYEKMYGKWPERLENLIRPYPNNVLSGEADGMKESFPYILKKLKEQAADGRASSPGSSGTADSPAESPESRGLHIGTNGFYEQAWSKPLEIIVDVESRQLIVVQNKLVIRSYRVGLGGERTPLGNFYISEKVRDPNGTDDGIFGSRGMTLSNTLYAIHGTNEPDSIGKDDSLGCIRMSKADVEELFDLVPLGTAVTIKNGAFPFEPKPPAERFKLQPKENETNPAKVYKWLT